MFAGSSSFRPPYRHAQVGKLSESWGQAAASFTQDKAFIKQREQAKRDDQPPVDGLDGFASGAGDVANGYARIDACEFVMDLKGTDDL